MLESLIAREMRGEGVRLNETCNGIYRQGKRDQKVAFMVKLFLPRVSRGTKGVLDGTLSA